MVQSKTKYCIMCIQKQDLVFIITLLILTAMNQYENSYAASLHTNNPMTTAQNDYFINGTTQERVDNILKISKEQTLLVRLPSNKLLKYNSYKDVSLLHFRIPTDTRRVKFTFKAVEESKSAFQWKCEPRNVTLHLKANSYPVISPENIPFPKNFLSADQRFKIYNLHFQSDERQQGFTIESPQVGNWYAVAFVNWADPNIDRIKQQGLSTLCNTLLMAEMSVSRFHPVIINNGQVHNSTLTIKEQYIISSSNGKKFVKNAERLQQYDQQKGKQQLTDTKTVRNSHYSNISEATISATTAEPKLSFATEFYTRLMSSIPYTSTLTSKVNSENKIKNSRKYISNGNDEIVYKFYVPRDIEVAKAHINFGHVCLQCPNVGFYVEANAVPNTEEEDAESHDSNYISRTILKPNQTEEISIEFYTQPLAWHYAVLRFVTQKELKVNSMNSPAISFETDSNATSAFYHLSLLLKIDYYDTLCDNQENMAEKNAQKNRCSETSGSDSEYYTIVNNTTQTKKLHKSWYVKKFRNMEFYPVLRQTYSEFFTYDYDLLPDEYGTVPTVLNLTAGMPVGFAFEVDEIYDIGGTLSFAVSMKYDDKIASNETTKTINSIRSSECNGILEDVDVCNGKNLLRSYQTIIVCMHLSEPGKPTWPDKCQYGERLLPASSIINNTDSNTRTGLIHVPFPESGQWYITMGLFCRGSEKSPAMIIDHVKEFVKNYAYMLEYIRKPCACAPKFSRYRKCLYNSDCLDAMNKTEILEIKECLVDSKCILNHVEMKQKFEVQHKFTSKNHFVSKNCSISVFFSISSSPCVAGRCGRHGRCYHYMSGGFVFSTCVCMKGYRGWDCTDDSQVPSSISTLNAFLLLTMSNILFLPSIHIAVRRHFYNEAIVYFFTMCFSILYHACDFGEDELNFCVVEISVLQFCDFYCGLMAIWFTLVAMSHVHHQFVLLLHTIGAILLAFGTELNKQSLWVFLAPALTGICLILTSWGIHCFKSRKWLPSRRYLLVYMPLGTALVTVGLFCYAFLQTKQNYHIVHSVWHVVMALSILCLLPSRSSFILQC